MTDRKVLVQVKLNSDLVKDVDHLSVEWDFYRTQAVEKLLREAIQVYKNQGVLWNFSTA